MNTLEILFENKIQHSVFLERKISIAHHYTIIIGPKKSGKSYLIYDYINKKDAKYLYIDFNNLKDLEFKENTLQDFINKHDIKILILENFTYNFNLPKVDSIIISTKEYKELNNFKKIIVMPLDFEEYLSFDIKHQNTTNSFNSFLKYGNLAQTIDFKDYKKQISNYELIKLETNNETKLKILELLIKNSSQNKSIFLLYTLLKKQIKISKDFFYKTVKEFQNNYTILFCEKLNYPKAVKKIFCYNHALIDTVTFNKNFTYLFTNLIYLELFKRYEFIYYSDYIDFYVSDNKTVLMSIPFYNQSQWANISAKILKELSLISCDKIFVITISTQDYTLLDNIPCEIIPFYEWSLSI